MDNINLDLVTSLFEKRFGKGGSHIVDLDKAPAQGQAGNHCPTGSIALDLALGVGGFQRGTVNEVYGHESSGKTTLALHIIKECQTFFPGPIAYIDGEHALAKEYAAAIGIDLSPARFTLVQENETEAALNMMQFFAEQRYAMVVLDSVASMVPKAQMDSGDSVDAKFGGNSKYLSTHLPKMISVCPVTGTIALYINQIREKFVTFGNPETTTGGRALKFYSSVRMETKVKERIKDKNGDVNGVTVEASIVKNKIGGAPYRKARYNVLFGQGIDKIGDLVDTAREKGIIEGSGWLTFGDLKVNGRDKMIEAVRSDKALQKTLTDTIWSVA